TVQAPPSFLQGKHTRFEHDQFDCRGYYGNTFRLIDNVSIWPIVPDIPGDRVTVKGELVHDRGRPPIVHFTHHDPWGTHEGGFIELGGRIYA
ncbi:MAG: hypothetical protein JWN27_1520, partial [Candidatus Eremiobacteraeota bacterium]|nr:hypothetical protein [Candidatus Eremiobacteraeota bacterium]